MSYEFEVPVRTYSEANLREHFMARAKRAQYHRWNGKMATLAALGFEDKRGSWEIYMVRVCPGLLDDDNLVRSMKAIRDGIADALGRDDGDRDLKFRYSQRKGPAKKYTVEVTMWRR